MSVLNKKFIDSITESIEAKIDNEVDERSARRQEIVDSIMSYKDDLKDIYDTLYYIKGIHDHKRIFKPLYDKTNFRISPQDSCALVINFDILGSEYADYYGSLIPRSCPSHFDEPGHTSVTLDIFTCNTNRLISTNDQGEMLYVHVCKDNVLVTDDTNIKMLTDILYPGSHIYNFERLVNELPEMIKTFRDTVSDMMSESDKYVGQYHTEEYIQTNARKLNKVFEK